MKYAVFFSLIFLVALMSFGDIAGSAHDFSSEAWSKGEICLPCHTPHNAISVTDAPLWNHQVTNTTFTLYSSSTLDSTIEQPRGPSKLCLSCHDGTIAIESFGSETGSTHMSGARNLGSNLSNDHPVSIEWNHTTVIGSTSTICINCHNMHSSQTFVSELPFYSKYVECSTCHDVHNKTSNEHLLRLSNNNSELCLYCHAK